MPSAPEESERLTAFPSPALRGEARVPGDKSLAHRALILAALAAGRSHIAGLPRGGDVMATARILEALGARLAPDGVGSVFVDGLGVGGLSAPDGVLDCGNSGTSARLLMGVLAGHAFPSVLSGDKSLRGRPMGRVMDPLSEMGAGFVAHGGRLPVTVMGRAPLLPASHRLVRPSAQVKSALMLAALHGRGESVIIEPSRTRDHTERMLALFGAEIRIEDGEGGAKALYLEGEQELAPANIDIAGDPSSAAFLAGAAALLRGSELRISSLCVNPLRMGFYRALREMGVAWEMEGEATASGEPVADLVFRGGGALSAIETEASAAPAMIDEYPILAVVAAGAHGVSRFRGLGELRVKESDRLAAIFEGLRANGVEARIEGEDLLIEGCGGPPRGGGRARSGADHRMAMAFLVLGLCAREPVSVEGVETIGTSFPNFVEIFRGLGAEIS